MSRLPLALIAALGLLAAASQAQATGPQPPTREQVRAEYLQARAQGLLPPSGEVGDVPLSVPGTSMRTRAEVRAEYLRARAQGLLPATGEVGDVFQAGAGTSTLTRAQVLRDLAIHGPMPSGEGPDLGIGRAR